MQITVFRGLGDKQGDNITDPLLCDEIAAAIRGRAAINYSIVDRATVPASCPKLAFIETGEIVRVHELLGTYTGFCRLFQRTDTMQSNSDDGESSNLEATCDCGVRIEKEYKGE